MNDIIDQLKNAPVARLEAIYNAAWRKAHNGIDTHTADVVMRAIATICYIRGIERTGESGCYEFSRGDDR